jgi:D-3-phosphoglycerate dehydrogenase
VKPTVRIVNAARGGIVDEKALYDAIKEGRVAGAGLDVYSTEPCTDSPLFEFENVVVTPHLGASTDEAQEKAGIAVARSVRLALAGELVPDAVNVKGGPIAEAVRPGIALAENIGRVAGTLAKVPVEAVEVVVLGEVAEHDVKILELSALKGVFSALVTDPVSYVNAPVLAGERGVTVSLTTSTQSANWRNTVRVHLSLTDGTQIVVGGTVTGPRNVQRLVELDGFELDVPFSNHIAFLRYVDRPGVVGAAGRLLGDEGINIAGMQVSRDEAGDQALIALTVDTTIPPDVLARVAAEIGALTAQSVDLEL